MKALVFSSSTSFSVIEHEHTAGMSVRREGATGNILQIVPFSGNFN